ncbi:hypothetical protein FRC09_014398, partial [Ceratobasidium sp. 395]
MTDALDLDHSYCARCETYIWPEKRQVEVQVPAKAAPAQPTKSKSGTIRGRPAPEPAMVTKIRTVISLDQTPLYCSERCRQSDLESGSANARRIMEHFQPSPVSTSSSPISPTHDQARSNSDYFSRIAAPIPFTHRRWKDQGPKPAADRSVDVDVAALYDSYPMSQRVRSTSSFGSSSSVRPGSMTASTASDTASIRTTSSRGSTTRRQYAGLSADATRGLLVPTVMIREDCTSPVRSVHSVSDDGEEEADNYFAISRNRTITQRTHSRTKSASSTRSAKSRSTDKTIQDLVREAGGPEYGTRQGTRPVSWSLSDRATAGPLYEITRTPPGPTKRHVVQEVEVGGKTELRIVEHDCWEEPQ